ncbi:MAG TPA: histidinol dehydrogenase [Chitinophagaceae bacterium]|nr:histidinol dehydrogenase [Chitinophagaceae bacterium]
MKRPKLDQTLLERQVAEILADIKLNGDAALTKYTLQFDGIHLEEFAVGTDEIRKAGQQLEERLKLAIGQAALNIRIFHRHQLDTVGRVETMPGVVCWHRYAPIERVGLYIPGGSAPLFSTLLMLGIPAKLAGCREIVLCTPPGPQGAIHPAILYTAELVGIHHIFRVGGIQAIGAMAFGTSTIPMVEKIFGPGNQYVSCAKKLVHISGTAIDIQAGPSEVAVLADDTAVPEFVAADLLAQAEHGSDSQVLLVTWDPELARRTQISLEEQLKDLPRAAVAARALENSMVILVKDAETAIELVNAYAPEHLIISCASDEQIAIRIDHAGSIFLGNYSPESAGDYASGTNHTLPTNGQARVFSGVSVDSFVKRITLQKLSREGLENIGPTVEAMAEAEGLEAHRRSVEIRLRGSKQEPEGKDKGSL